MATWTEYASRYSDNTLTDNLKELKKHFTEYFITGDAGQGVVNLKLDIIGDETLTADCDVTDHYVESNIAYQDQISIKPKIYTVNGEVGELVWYQKDPISQTFGQVSQRLEGVISFLPIRSRGFNQFKKKAMKAFQWIDTASNAVSKLANLTEIGNNQQQSYMRLVEFRDARTPLTIKSPWGILKDYAITNLKFTQPKETKDKSLISITFKEFRVTSVSSVEFDPEKYQGNALYENQPKIDDGSTDGGDASLPTTTKEVDGEKIYSCAVTYDDNLYMVDFSDKYGFSVQDGVTEKWLSHGSAEYKGAVSIATKECDEIIGALK